MSLPGSVRRSAAVTVTAVVALLCLAQGAGASTLIGSPLTGSPEYSYGQIKTYVGVENAGGVGPQASAPVSGVLVAIKVKHGNVSADAPIRFRILTGTYTGSGSANFTARPATPDGSALPTLTVLSGTPAGISTYLPKDAAGDPVGVPIAAREYLGATMPANFQVLIHGAGDLLEFVGGHDNGAQTYVLNGRELTIQGTIEPDADGDRYGDETQDGCPSNAAIHLTGCDGGVSIVPPPIVTPISTLVPPPVAATKKKCPKGKKLRKVGGKRKCVKAKKKKKQRHRG